MTTTLEKLTMAKRVKEELKPIPIRFTPELIEAFRYIIYRRPSQTIAGIVRIFCEDNLPHIVARLKEEELIGKCQYVKELRERNPKDEYNKAFPRS